MNEENGQKNNDVNAATEAIRKFEGSGDLSQADYRFLCRDFTMDAINAACRKLNINISST